METRTLGQGLQVSALGLGDIGVAGARYNEAMQKLTGR